MTQASPARRVHPIVSLDYRLRSVAAVLAGIVVATVLRERAPGALTWTALALYALVWPHVAFLNARYGRDTKNTETTNLFVDGAMAGAWIALLHFNPWPTMMFVVALTLGYLSVGGIALCLAATGALVAAAVFTGALTGFAFDLTTSVLTLAASAVCLLTYAVMFGIVTNRQARQIIQSHKMIEATAEIARATNSSPTSVAPVLATITEQIARLCGTVDVTIFEKEGALLRRIAAHGTLPRRAAADRTTIPVTAGTVSGRAVLDARPVRITDLATDTDPAYAESRALQQGWGIRSLLAVPMLRDGAVLGVILLRRAEVRPFDARETEMVQTFANHGAVALENARLFEALGEKNLELTDALARHGATSDILRVIARSPTDIQPVFDAIVRSAVRLCDGDQATAYRYEGGQQHFVAHHNMPDDVVARMRGLFPRPPDREAVTGRAILERAIVHVPDILADSRFAYTAGSFEPSDRIRSVLAVPMLRDDEPMGAIFVSRAGEGPRPFSEEQIALLRTFADQAVIAVENVRLFRAIEEKTAQVEAATRAKSQFLANMSHELRTPLNAIIGYTELAIEETYGEIPEKLTDILERIGASGKHLLSLINDVLDLSKIEAGQLTLALDDYSMRDVVGTAFQSVEALAVDKGLAVRVDVGDDLPVARGDARRLTQVVLNLLGNAIKFTDAGEVALTATFDGRRLHVTVADTGPGIAPADQERIFDEFRQVDSSDTRKKGGTGLGLAIARRIVMLHGGRLWVESALGRGATFRFTVPVRVDRAAGEA